MKDDKKQLILSLGSLGWSLRRIERETGIRRETIANYLKTAGIGVRPPGEWGRGSPPATSKSEIPDSKPAIEVSADSVGSKPAIGVSTDLVISKPAIEVSTDSRGSSSSCEPYREIIEEALRLGRNSVGIWQDLVSQYGFQSSQKCVYRFIRKIQPANSPEAKAVIYTEPGEEAQVDYGDGPMVRDPITGKYRRARLFCLTLGYSRKAVRLLTFQSSSQIWAELHEKAFRRLGGVPRVIILDNLAEGVAKADFYDPTLNPLFRDLLAHYGAVALPCRVRHPDRKGKVESSVGHAQKTPLKGKRFESIEEAQDYLDQWEARWADTRIHGTTKRQVARMFAEEKPTLLPLPLEPFRFYKFGNRTVHLDSCVEVEAAYYSAPPIWIGRVVYVQWDRTCVRIIDPKTGQLLREHYRQHKGLHRIHDEDRSSRTLPKVATLIKRAHQAGPNLGKLCDQIHKLQAQPGVRRIQGLLGLTKKYGTAATDCAAAAVLSMGRSDYRLVRQILEHQPELPLTLQQVDPLIRSLIQYRDLINERTKEENESK